MRVRTMHDEIRGVQAVPEWQAYLRGEHAMPQRTATSLGGAAIVLHYLGDAARAQEVSYAASIAYAREVQRYIERLGDERKGLFPLFYAALYRNLAGRRDEARPLWERLVHIHRHIPMDAIRESQQGCERMWAAYALLQLGHYREVQASAHQGHLEILLGQSIESEFPNANSLELYLGDVLITLAAYHLDPYGDDLERQIRGMNRARDTLAHYADHNRRNHRYGYGVIFDLQLAFRDVYYLPVLPGGDPTLD